MVSFRLSLAEYQAAENKCRTRGFRSMSLYARSALLEFAASNSCVPPDHELTDIRLRLESLTLEVQRLVAGIVKSVDKSSEQSLTNAPSANRHRFAEES